MKNVFIAITLVAFLGAFSATNTVSAQTTASSVVKPDEKKCPHCGKINCDGKCMAERHKCQGQKPEGHKCKDNGTEGHKCQGQKTQGHKCPHAGTEAKKCCPHGQQKPCLHSKTTTETPKEEKK
ncbi:MAG: hypothetical protein KJ607_04100 [Bacteroidetes bacterium]|nr:hypothetical protein [Bacteroidota bacterium]